MAPPLLDGCVATPDMADTFKTLGNYALVELMGRGGMGEVWHAIERDTLQRVAVKVLSPEVARRTRGIANLRREGEIGMQLGTHDWIVAVQGVHETLLGDPSSPERVVYLVMDLVDGVNLRQYADRYRRTMGERLPIRVVVHIIRAVLRALDTAHTNTIGGSALTVVHGDINPGNVLISSRGEIRVTDFGISRFAPEPSFVSRPVGTLPYMAPEQYRGVIRPQNDLYAVGAVIHELLTGSPPLAEGGGPITSERRLLEEPIPPLGRDDVPPAFERLRRGLLEKDADLRIPTADKALEILDEVDDRDHLREIRFAYRRMFGPPRSRMTRYLTTHGVGADSFVMDLILRYEQAVSGQSVGARSSGDAVDAAPSSKVPDPEPDAGSDEDEGVPWLADDEDAVETQEHHRSGPGDSGRVGEGSLWPLDEDAEAIETTPRPAAAIAKLTLDPRRYPPRPPHLEDGVPFQRRRPKPMPVEGAEPERSSSADGLDAACGIGSVGLAVSEPEHVITAPDDDPYAATTATTDG